MGILSTVLTVASVAYSARESKTSKRRAKHAEEDITSKLEAEQTAAEEEARRKNEDRRKRLAAYGRQSTFSAGALSAKATTQRKLLGG